MRFENPFRSGRVSVQRIEMSAVCCDEKLMVGDDRFDGGAEALSLEFDSPCETKWLFQFGLDETGVLRVAAEHGPFGASANCETRHRKCGDEREPKGTVTNGGNSGPQQRRLPPHPNPLPQGEGESPAAYWPFPRSRNRREARLVAHH